MKIPYMANLPSIPDLHDGSFDGVWVSDKKCACLFVRTENGEPFTILLTNVARLNIRNLRQGNIIFDVVLITPDALSIEQVNETYDLGHEREEMSRRLLEKAQQQGLCALVMSTSYGAEGTVLFQAAKVVPGHVFE